MIDDAAALAIGEGLPSLHSLNLKRCVQISDDAIKAIASGCKELAHLSLSNVPAVSDVALVALRDNCSASLRTLDISFCRGITDHSLGSLVDASPLLEKVTIWGCSQLTALFFDGHSKDELTIVGRCYA